MPLDDGNLITSWLLTQNNHLKVFLQSLHPNLTDFTLPHPLFPNQRILWWTVPTTSIRNMAPFCNGHDKRQLVHARTLWVKEISVPQDAADPSSHSSIKKLSDLQLYNSDWTHLNQYSFHQTAQVSFDYPISESRSINIVLGWDCKWTLLSIASE